MRQWCQQIIKSARVEWTKNQCPVLNTMRCKYGPNGKILFPLSSNQLDPYSLFSVHPVLKDKRNDQFLMQAVQALWKRNCTNQPHLRAQLTKQMSNAKVSISKLKQILKNIVQLTPPQFQLDVLSVKT